MPLRKVFKQQQKNPTPNTMASDTSMPPSEAPTPKPGAYSDPNDMGMMAPQGGAPADGGSVMMQMPKEAFDAIHQLVMQLAQALEGAAQKVNSQAQGGGVPAPEMTGAEQPPEAGAVNPDQSADEADLAKFAQELNNRGR